MTKQEDVTSQWRNVIVDIPTLFSQTSADNITLLSCLSDSTESTNQHQTGSDSNNPHQTGNDQKLRPLEYIHEKRQLPQHTHINTISRENITSDDNSKLGYKLLPSALKEILHSLQNSPIHSNLAIIIIFATGFRAYCLSSMQEHLICHCLLLAGLMAALCIFKEITFNLYLFILYMLTLSIHLLSSITNFPTAKLNISALLAECDLLIKQHMVLISWYLFTHHIYKLFKSAGAIALASLQLHSVNFEFKSYDLYQWALAQLLKCCFVVHWLALAVRLGLPQVQSNCSYERMSKLLSYEQFLLLLIALTSLTLLFMTISCIWKLLSNIYKSRKEGKSECQVSGASCLHWNLHKGCNSAVFVISLYCYVMMLYLDHSCTSFILNGLILIVVQISLL